MQKIAHFISNEFLCGGVKKDENTYEIFFTPLKNIPQHTVYRAYFAHKNSSNLTSIGVVNIIGNNALLKATVKNSTDTVVIMQKDTKSNDLTFTASAFFGEKWDVESFFSDNHIRKILSLLNKQIENYKKDENGFYLVTNFTALGNLSSIKYVLFEKDVNYSFDKYGHYLFKIENNIITIGIKKTDDKTAFFHIKDFCTEEDGVFYVKIALENDGQYFLTD